MRWVSHAAIAGSLAALVHPAAVPVAILGSTAPDWLEWALKVLGKRIKHRQETHYLFPLGSGFTVLPDPVGLARAVILVQSRRTAARAL